MKKLLKIALILFAGFFLMMMINAYYLNRESKQLLKNASFQYASSRLNIRKEPNLNSEIIGLIEFNEKIMTLDSISNGFVRVITNENRQFGWASLKYLQSTEISPDQKKLEKQKREKRLLVEQEKKKKKDLERNPLGLDSSILKELRYERIPKDKYEEWGNLKTLEGTNNDIWVAYFPKANISFVAKKKNNMILFADFGEEKAIQHVKKESKEKKAKFESQFSSWDGSNRYLTSYIKSHMHDASSYEHVKTYFLESSDHVTVKTTFRGTNVYGATVIQEIVADIDPYGNIIGIPVFN